eukprot:gene11221-21405_t
MTNEQTITEKCIRTTYYIGKEKRPYSDYEQLIGPQIQNGLDMRRTLHSRWSCTEMIDVASTTMRESLAKEIVDNERKMSLIVGESTSAAKDSCLIIYLRALLNGSPENILLSMIEFQGQDADSVTCAIVKVLNENKITDEYRTNNLVAFTSDGASVMTGVNRRVATKLKEKYSQIITWHCLNHRLELAVGDAIKSVKGVNQVEAFVSKIYCVYSQSPKMQRELSNIASGIDTELRKVGRLLTTRWVASSYRAVASLGQNYSALLKHFEKVANASENSENAMYKGLLCTMQTKQFAEDIGLLKDCLGQLAIL